MKRFIGVPSALLLLIGLLMTVSVACGDDDEDADVVAKADKAEVVAEADKAEEVAVKDDKFGGTLRMVSPASVGSLDPIFASGFETVVLGNHIYEIPFGWDDNFDIVPRMTEEWEVSSDGKEYTFTNRKDLVFHNGEKVTSDDMIASLKRWLTAGYATAGLMRDRAVDPVDPFERVDDRTYKLKLAQPYGEVLRSWSYLNRIPIVVPKALVDAAPTQSEELPEIIGSGPYKLELFEQGNRVVMVRHEAYVPRKDQPQQHNLGGSAVAYIDKLEWLEIPEDETKVAGLETGEWDALVGANLDFLKRLQGNAKLNINFYKGFKSVFTLNSINPPLDKKLVRQAVLAVIDVDAMMTAWGPTDAWQLCPAWYWCGTPQDSKAGSELYNQKDPEKAKRLLAEAGYDNEVVTLMNSSDNAIVPSGPGIILKQVMEDAGFNVDAPGLDWSTLISLVGKTDQWNIFSSARVHWALGDPLSDPTYSGTVGFMGQPDDLVALRMEYILEADPAGKKAIMDKIQAGLYDFVPEIRLGEWFAIYPATKALKGFAVKSMPLYFNAWLER